MKKLLLGALFILFIAACGQADGNQETSEPSTNDDQLEIAEGEKHTITIEMESGEQMVAELYPEIAPKTVENFLSLVNDGFYDGLIFHRVIPGFMIQGGDPNGDGTGGPGYSIEGEFESNGFENPLKHTDGVLSMARSQDPDSAGSQFFIIVEDSPHLDGEYAGFGKVVEGLEVAHKIVEVERDNQGKPIEEQVISTITATD